ncbi:hypothetical protein KUTeg_006973 [Tegillarca granosa]|uniref:DDE-1 domain-containing protein n=1 Tax=Tegillarca granosa TaxID=220873 RepID=A0ABQ9FBW9_TEGGR|nr:hypothetical protein KUTeg_006973 [Tegillarca granosa]
MGRNKKAKPGSPAKKYKRGFPKTPTKTTKAKKALFEVQSGQSILKTAEKYNLSYSYLQRRVSGTVGLQSRNGPSPYLTTDEEEMIANYVSEMALRGMGLGPSDIIDLVQEFLKKEKRKAPFKDNRPSYTWYYGFMGRHFNKLEKRKETLLEASRSKVTPQAMDNWFDKYRKFFSDRDMLDKPERILNADEIGFTMGSKAGNVIGPSKTVYSEDIPHVSGGSSKQRLTVMYCANAEGNMLPPFFVYPEPEPTAYDPLIGAARGSRVEYTPKGWMDATTFSKFIDHFDANVDKTNRPTLLLLDSLQETYLAFYKPSIIIGGFKGSGIYPVNREAISQNRLKPSATFDLGNEDKELDVCETALEASENENNSTLKSTPDQSSTVSPNTLKSTPDQSSTVSPLLVEILKLPQAKTQKPKPKRLIDSLPYSLTSSDSIRKMALDKLKCARNTAKKEKTAKERYLKKREKELSKSSSSEAAKPSISRKCVSTKRSKARPSSAPSVNETICPVCIGSFEEENSLEMGTVWIECDKCHGWMHKDCIPLNHDFNASNVKFTCHVAEALTPGLS